MCGPVAPILAIASAVVSAGGQLYSGAAQRSQARYETAIANQNRGIELRARDQAMERGEIEQLRHWRRVSQQLGEARARGSAAGLDISFGSAAGLQQDIALIGQEDSEIIGRNTMEEVRGYEVNAANYTMQGRAARARGKAAMTSAAIGAFSTILGAAQQTSGMRASRANAGI